VVPAALGGRAHVHLVDKDSTSSPPGSSTCSWPSRPTGRVLALTQDLRPSPPSACTGPGRSAGRDWGLFLAALRRVGPGQAVASAGSPGRWNGSSRRGMRWPAAGSARRPRRPRRAQPDPGAGRPDQAEAQTTGRSRHRWSRCCRRWPRPSCSGAASAARAGDPRRGRAL